MADDKAQDKIAASAEFRKQRQLMNTSAGSNSISELRYSRDQERDNDLSTLPSNAGAPAPKFNTYKVTADSYRVASGEDSGSANVPARGEPEGLSYPNSSSSSRNAADADDDGVGMGRERYAASPSPPPQSQNNASLQSLEPLSANGDLSKSDIIASMPSDGKKKGGNALYDGGEDIESAIEEDIKIDEEGYADAQPKEDVI